MRMSGLPSPSKSATATPCGLVPPTPVLSAILSPDAAVTSTNRAPTPCGRAGAVRPPVAAATRRTATQDRRMASPPPGPGSLLGLPLVQRRHGLGIAIKHGAVPLGILANEVQQLDLVAER